VCHADLGSATIDLQPMTAEIIECMERLRPVLAAHAGGIELVEVDGGTVRLRFTGMCTGCHLRPLTTASTIRPALLGLAGVEAVEIEGSRISAEAEARLAAAFGAVSAKR
jgi:Fe-S cluster biogenesis protein NfuA